MKKNHKIIISIGIILVVALAGFQINKALASNRQMQENKIASDKLLLKVQENDKKEKIYVQVVNTIKQTDWDKSNDEDWENVRNMLKEISGYKDEPNISMYLNSLKYYNNGDFNVAFRIARQIPDIYDGSLKDEVVNLRSNSKEAVLKEIQEDRDQGNDFSADYNLIHLGLKPLPTIKPQPTIGMTTNEVENSQWGKPIKVNRTTTAYGVSEQWVYGSSRYVYLDNGIVKAIQE